MSDYQISEGMFQGFDGTELFYKHWIAEAPKLHLIIVHGLGEHCDRYGNLISYFAGQGISFYSMDHRGHGRSAGQRGHVMSWDDFLRDLDIRVNQVMEQANVKKVLMFGHSMGANILINYALKHSDKLLGMMISSPGLRTNMKINPLKKAMSGLISKIYPSLSMPSKLPPEAISRDQKVVKDYINDPMVHDRVTPRWFTEFIFHGEKAIREISSLQIPMLFIQGMQDKLVDPNATKECYANIKFSKKKLLLYDDLYHETLNELEKDRLEVLAQIKEWINRTFA